MGTFEFTDKKLNKELYQVGQLKKMKAGEVLMNSGDILKYIPIVLKGSIRVMAQNEEEEEFFLYHIYPGETCAMSLTCCMAQRKSSVKGVAEEDTEILLVPIQYVDEWANHPEWKKYVSTLQAQRFSELLETIELLAFKKLDEQLWNYLLKRVQATGNNVLKITHQDIANELHSPREVITRLLHQLQKQKKITLSRNTITVISAL